MGVAVPDAGVGVSGFLPKMPPLNAPPLGAAAAADGVAEGAAGDLKIPPLNIGALLGTEIWAAKGFNNRFYVEYETYEYLMVRSLRQVD